MWLPSLMLWLLDESFNKKSSQTNNCCFYWSSSGSRRPRVSVCCRVRQPTPSGPRLLPSQAADALGSRLLPSQAADALGSPSVAESGSWRPLVPVNCRVRQRTPTGLRQLPSQAAAPGNPSATPVRGITESSNPHGKKLNHQLDQVQENANSVSCRSCRLHELTRFIEKRMLSVAVRVDYTRWPSSGKSVFC